MRWIQSEFGFWRGNYTGCVGAGDMYGESDLCRRWSGAAASLGWRICRQANDSTGWYAEASLSAGADEGFHRRHVEYDTLVGNSRVDELSLSGEVRSARQSTATWVAHSSRLTRRLIAQLADRLAGPCPQDQGDTTYMAPCSSFTGIGGSATAYAAARSAHPGGVNVAMSDGSVRFAIDDVSQRVWRAMGTRGLGDNASAD